MTCSERRAETFIGLDVHKKQIVAAMLLQDGEVKETRQPHTAPGITRLVRWMRKESQGGFECCYEAGFCGYDLCRQLTGHGVLCRVVAPSQTPHAPGDRVKTDRRDARKLAWYLRAGMLSEVRLPTEEQEALRGLCRCRDDARRALHTARQQLVSFLDQRGLFYPQGPHWTTRHWSWAKSLRFENAIAQMTYEQYLSHVELEEARLREIDAQLREVAESEPYREPVGYLCCFRGIQWLTAILLLGELYDMGRFESPRTLMAYLGLTPSEQSSGEREQKVDVYLNFIGRFEVPEVTPAPRQDPKGFHDWIIGQGILVNQHIHCDKRIAGRAMCYRRVQIVLIIEQRWITRGLYPNRTTTRAVHTPSNTP